jgi:hypothetical protein
LFDLQACRRNGDFEGEVDKREGCVVLDDYGDSFREQSEPSSSPGKALKARVNSPGVPESMKRKKRMKKKKNQVTSRFVLSISVIDKKLMLANNTNWESYRRLNQ